MSKDYLRSIELRIAIILGCMRWKKKREGPTMKVKEIVTSSGHDTRRRPDVQSSADWSDLIISLENIYDQLDF